MERFWEKVDIPDDLEGCWLWTGAIQQKGYGVAWWNQKTLAAHRLVYQLLVGPITNETLDHLCRVRHCVN
ncbi:hypothetical protein LCGC14_2615630, partial [marine sediment metagenome]